MKRYGTLAGIAVACIAFWGFVFWVSDAFKPVELALLIGGGLVLFGCWLSYEARHAPHGFETRRGYGPVSEQHSTDEWQVPDDWFDWPEPEDVSAVRHGGLGR